MRLKPQSFDWLREINTGRISGHTKDWIISNYPDFFPTRDKDHKIKLHLKYPDGESFYDVYERLRRPLLEFVDTKINLIILAHNGTNRMIRSILLNKNPVEYVDVRQKNNEIIMINLKNLTEKSLLIS